MDQTCKMLYHITDSRAFWVDQLRCLYFVFQPLLLLQLDTLSISELREMVTKPYHFDKTVITQKIHRGSAFHLKPNLSGDFVDAKIVPGGRWLVTLSTEWNGNWEPRFRSLKTFRSVAKVKLPVDHTPLEVCLQSGDAPLDLLVFVSVFKTGNPYDGGYIRVLRINLADDDPEFSLVAELGTDKFCTGMCLQHGNVVAGFYAPGVNRAEAFAWNWENGAKVEVLSPEGKHWFLVVSETMSMLWNANNRSIDVRRSTKSDRPNEDRHLPRHSDTFPDPQQGLQAIIPVITECKKFSGDTSQVALAHLEHETLRIDIEDLGAGRVSFTRYPKDNTTCKIQKIQKILLGAITKHRKVLSKLSAVTWSKWRRLVA
ncbi:hypothetical protein FRC00_003544 [Tulasnella sp. 408]|nr:hypothetical protein FRC00_003544 [Tulasnella sp. 408]